MSDVEKSAEEDNGMEMSGRGTIRGMAGLGRRDLTQIGKDNKTLFTNVWVANGVGRGWTSSVLGRKFEIL